MTKIRCFYTAQSQTCFYALMGLLLQATALAQPTDRIVPLYAVAPGVYQTGISSKALFTMLNANPNATQMLQSGDKFVFTLQASGASITSISMPVANTPAIGAAALSASIGADKNQVVITYTGPPVPLKIAEGFSVEASVFLNEQTTGFVSVQVPGERFQTPQSFAASIAGLNFESQTTTLPRADGTGQLIGPRGATGPAGPAGATGPAGPVGISGPPGSDGAVGPQGPNGPPGSNGAVGPVGPAGLTGATGPLGPAGPAGSQGANGPQGIQGVPGNTGSAGATGAAGTTGPPITFRGSFSAAITYTVGDGVSFTDGSSYVSLQSGNTNNTPGGSPTFWSLLAQAGATGAVGPVGATGALGPAGPAGSQGANGPQGIQGVPGNTGSAGATGAAGTTGPPITFRGSWSAATTYTVGDSVSFTDGSSYVSLQSGNTNNTPGGSPTFWSLLAQAGATGAVGPVGATGALGPAGPAGSQGANGPQGIQGVPGNTGSAGATGAAGTTGPPIAFQGSWSAATTYTVGDGVRFTDGSSYVSLQSANRNNTPGGSPAFWSLLAQAGATGAVGPVGATGALGPAGPAGSQGANGPQGIQGVPGNPGSAGATGAAGTTGPPIAFQGSWSAATTYTVGDGVRFTDGSSYVSLQSGNTNNTPGGSPTFWSLLAQAGATGSQGNQGVPGTNGAQGVQGIQGPQGSAGTNGTNGSSITFRGAWSSATTYTVGDSVSFTNGSSYISLQSGNTNNTPGSSPAFWSLLAQAGALGAQGNQGVQGPQGAQGVPGTNGSQGVQGIPGVQGPQGPAGPAGAGGNLFSSLALTTTGLRFSAVFGTSSATEAIVTRPFHNGCSLANLKVTVFDDNGAQIAQSAMTAGIRVNSSPVLSCVATNSASCSSVSTATVPPGGRVNFYAENYTMNIDHAVHFSATCQ